MENQNRRGPRGPHPKRISAEIGQKILDYCLERPTHDGPRRVANELRLQGIHGGSSGGRGLWLRHNYGLDVSFHKLSAIEVHEVFSNTNFDFIIFNASVEHMTHEERMSAMFNTWNMLPKGGFWCVIETPNRLWYFDYHTSQLPFYFWLPDNVAFKYSCFSKRKNLKICPSLNLPEVAPLSTGHFSW